MGIAQNLANIYSQIAESALRAGRKPEDITLIAVSKQQPVEAIEMAIQAGQKDFGENRIQEILTKWPSLKARYPEVRLHFIGHLQRNKVKEALSWCEVIHSVDNIALAEVIAKEQARLNKVVECFLQVNTGAEPQKSGISPKALPLLWQKTQSLGLHVKGLMCIPPQDQDPGPHFALLKQLAEGLRLPCLSMGMSADFQIAIAEGATHIRVGTALFR